MQGGISRAVIRRTSDKDLKELIEKHLANYASDSPIREMVDESLIYHDIIECARRKKYKDVVSDIIGPIENRDYYDVFADGDSKFLKTIREVQLFILLKDIRFPKHKPRLLKDKNHKERWIIASNFSRESIVHYATIRMMKPYFKKGLYQYACSGVKGRGVHYAMGFARDALQKDPEGTKYALLADIRECYENVKKSILKNKIRQVIKDRDLRRIIFAIIDVKEGDGLVTGFATSEWFLNFYLQDFDHYIKERILDDIYGKTKTDATGRHGIKYYYRYADNILMLHPSKKELHAAKKRLDDYLATELGLRFKYDWQIFLVDTMDKDGTRRGRYIDFLGFKLYRDKVKIRTKTYKRIMKLIKELKKKNITEITPEEASAMIAYHGIIYWTDAKGLYEKFCKPYIKIKQLKKILKKEHKKQKNLVHKLQNGRYEDFLASMRKKELEESGPIQITGPEEEE